MSGRIYLCPFSARMASKTELLWLPTGTQPIEVDAALFGESLHLTEVVAKLVPPGDIPHYSPDGSDACCACYRTKSQVILISRSRVRAELAKDILEKMRPFWSQYRGSTGMAEARPADPSSGDVRIAIALEYHPVSRADRRREGAGASESQIIEQMRTLAAKGVRHGDVTERWLPAEFGSNIPPLLGIGLASLYGCWRRAALAEREQIAQLSWVLTDVPCSPIGHMQTDPRFYSRVETIAGNPASVDDDIAAVQQVLGALGRASGGTLPKDDALRLLPVTGTEFVRRVLEEREKNRGSEERDPDETPNRSSRRCSWKLVAGVAACVGVLGAVSVMILKTPNPEPSLSSAIAPPQPPVEEGAQTKKEAQQKVAPPSPVPPEQGEGRIANPEPALSPEEAPIAESSEDTVRSPRPLVVEQGVPYSVKGDFGPFEDRPEIEFLGDHEYSDWRLKQYYGDPRNELRYSTRAEMRVHFSLETELVIRAELKVARTAPDLDLILIKGDGEEICFADRKLALVSRKHEECPSGLESAEGGVRLQPGNYRLVVLAPNVGTKICGPESVCKFELSASFAK